MAYKPVLSVRVEALGAVFYFQPPDNALAKLAARAEGISEFDTDDVPESMLELMPDMFIEGVRHWDGVEAADGEPLPCTEEHRRAIPTQDKIAVVNGYLVKLQEISVKKGALSEPPTDSTPSESSLPEPGA